MFFIGLHNYKAVSDSNVRNLFVKYIGSFDFFESVLSLSGIATCTHRPQGVIIMGIYMSSNIYYYYYCI